LNFSSVVYPFFLLVVVGVFWALARSGSPRVRTLRHLWLLSASYFFYGWWDVRFVALLMATTLLDYAMGLLIGRTQDHRRRKMFLCFSLCGNLGVLGFFKYFNFFAAEVTAGLGHLGLPALAPHLNVILPAGVSFYTFQSMSYTIDIYRGTLQPRRSLLDFATFISFFPQLVAGPIVRAAYLLPQLERPPKYDDRNISFGVYRILVGLAKKVIIADALGTNLVDPVFGTRLAAGNMAEAAAPAIALAVYAYALQIYCDFSGYSDIAIGSARLMGFEFPENFNRPYQATDMRDFWRRWHMSLSTWLRDYLYIPLGGSRRGVGRTYFALIMTMFLGGLWHGAAWTFVLWGVYHGTLLALTRWWQRRRKNAGKAEATHPVVVWMKMAATFNLVCFGWLLFRATSIGQVGVALSRLADWNIAKVYLPMAALLALAAGTFAHFTPKSWMLGLGRSFERWPAPAQALACCGVIWVTVLMANAVSPFIYFQF
jgi:D-alanyl-lipoteichoic acid acyltransferase DltB (MBOAT superfamily)